MGSASFFAGASLPAVLLAVQHHGKPELELLRAALAVCRSWPSDPGQISCTQTSYVQNSGNSNTESSTCPHPSEFCPETCFYFPFSQLAETDWQKSMLVGGSLLAGAVSAGSLEGRSYGLTLRVLLASADPLRGRALSRGH